MSVLLGVDVGTSAVKALAVDAQGRCWRGSVPYRSSNDGDGRVEQDPAEYVDASCQAIAACGAPLDRVTSIGIVGQTPTVVLADERGEAVRPAMTWQDVRAAGEARQLEAELGDAVPLVGTTLAWSATNLLPKLLWLARHEPASVRRTRWVLQPKDFLGLWLTGDASSDPWSSKGLCNVRTGAIAVEAMRAVGWPQSVVPPIAPAWRARGVLRPAPAARLGLPAGIPVAVGWSDALAGMLALGAFSSPRAFLLTGTSEIVGVTADADAPPTAGLLSIPTSCAPLAAAYGPTHSSGSAMRWIAGLLGEDEAGVLRLAEGSTATRPPTFVPYLAGERAPVWSSTARGAFFGLAPEHGRPELARAVLMGLGYGARHVLEAARDAVGGDGGDVHLGGQPSRHAAWRSLRAEALSARLVPYAEPESSCLGAVILGAAAAGRSLPEATSLLAREDHPVAPSAAERGAGDAGFRAYERASRAVLAWGDAP